MEQKRVIRLGEKVLNVSTTVRLVVRTVLEMCGGFRLLARYVPIPQRRSVICIVRAQQRFQPLLAVPLLCTSRRLLLMTHH